MYDTHANATICAESPASINQSVLNSTRIPIPPINNDVIRVTKKIVFPTKSSAMTTSHPRAVNNAMTFLPASIYL